MLVSFPQESAEAVFGLQLTPKVSSKHFSLTVLGDSPLVKEGSGAGSEWALSLSKPAHAQVY